MFQMTCCRSDTALTEETPLTNTKATEKPLQDQSDDHNKQSKKQLIIGYGFALLATCGMAASVAFVQALNRTLPHSELNGLRFTFQLFLSCILIPTIGRCDIKVAQNEIPWVSCNAVCITVSSYCHFGAAYYLPVGYVAGLSIGLEMIIASTIGFFIKKHVSLLDLIAVALCTTGIVLTIQPNVIFHGVGF